MDATLPALGACVFAGALTMRSTGLGFALVAAPFLTIVLGPFDGILVANACSVGAALVTLTQVHRDIDWHRARWVVPAGVLGVVPGAIAARTLPSAQLAVVVSAVVLIALALTVVGRRMRVPASPVIGGVGGLASGFMNATAGVGGPGLVVYAMATRWEHRRFAATAQLHFAVLGAMSLLLKGSLPRLDWAGWVVAAVAVAAGLAVGTLLARRIDGAKAMWAVVVIAAVGAVAALIKALLSLG